MLTMTLMRGIPSSGKSTHAAQVAAETGAVIVCPEDICDRLAAEGRGWQGRHNALGVAYQTARANLGLGTSVVVDACNVHDHEIQRWLAIAVDYGAGVRIVELRTPLEECLTRNLFSARRLPEEVLRRIQFGLGCPLPSGTAVLVETASTQREEEAA